jgi:CheY-like chemotaxis protein
LASSRLFPTASAPRAQLVAASVSLEAPNAVSALEILDRQAGRGVELLFTDIGLPGAMNGLQLSEEARRRRPELKVLLATAYAGNPIVQAGRLEPAVWLMNKPYSFADLTLRVRGALDSRVAATVRLAKLSPKLANARSSPDGE